jgi:hypothetical protein
LISAWLTTPGRFDNLRGDDTRRLAADEELAAVLSAETSTGPVVLCIARLGDATPHPTRPSDAATAHATADEPNRGPRSPPARRAPSGLAPESATSTDPA